MPQIKGGPAGLNKILESAYQSCMKDGDSGKCSGIAWGAAKKAGWRKSVAGTWTKASEHYEESVFDFGLDGKLRVKVYNEYNGKIELFELDKVNWVIKGGRKTPVSKYQGERGEGRGISGERQGLGPPSACICPSCGMEHPKEINVPCATKTCSKCGTPLVGKE